MRPVFLKKKEQQFNPQREGTDLNRGPNLREEAEHHPYREITGPRVAKDPSSKETTRNN